MVVPYYSGDLVRTLVRVPNQANRQSDASFLNLGAVSSLAAGENVSSTLPSALQNAVTAGILPPAATKRNPQMLRAIAQMNQYSNPMNFNPNLSDAPFWNYVKYLYYRVPIEKRMTAQTVIISLLLKLHSC